MTALLLVLYGMVSCGLVASVPGVYREIQRRRAGERSRLSMTQVDPTKDRFSYSHAWSGQMYRVETVSRHICVNRNQTVNGTLWICECGRAYVQRGHGHDFRDTLRNNRRFWWRVRWYLPWQWRRAWIVRGLKRDRYLLEGEGSV